MSGPRPPRVALVAGLATGTSLVLGWLVVQVLSHQSAGSAFRVLWDVLGFAGLVLVIAYAWSLRRGARER